MAEKSRIADPVDDEGFRGGFGGGNFVVVIADEQIGTQPDPFPADEQTAVVFPMTSSNMETMNRFI